MSQALYRKWRPATFDDVVGQEPITGTLKRQVESSALSHAYLFTGSRGTGKTSCAKILAKAVNCTCQKGGNPCGICPICLGIDADSIPEVEEIDAASNSGVDYVRDLREKAFFRPASVKYRVYIIDEAHMLSTGAFNALLKIMEEPPEHVVFILATTELHKVPATIISRCQRFDFHRISPEIIARRLAHVAEEEGLSLDDQAALLIAQLSDGGMRDALSLLDICSVRGKHITAELVRTCAGLTDESYLLEIADAISSRDVARALDILSGLWELSIDYERLCGQLIAHYRNLMILKSAREPGKLLRILPDQLNRLKEQAESYDLERILIILEQLQDALNRMGRTSNRRTEMEMALVRLCSGRLPVSRDMSSRLEKLEALVKQGRPPAGRLSSPSHEEKKDAAASGQVENQQDMPVSTVQEAVEKAPVEPFADWDRVMEALLIKNKALYGALTGSTAYTHGNLMLVDAQNNLFLEMMRGDSYAKTCLRDILLELTGIKYRLGPYNPQRYKAAKGEDKTVLVDQLLQKATDSGIDVNVK